MEKTFIEKNINNSVLPINISGMEKIIDQMKKYICKIHKKGEKSTGFFCKIPYPDSSHLLNVLITNNHVLNEEDIQNGKEFTLSINNEEEYKTIIIDDTRKKYTSKEYDITLIEIKENKDEIYDFLEVNEKINKYEKYLKDIYNNKSIYILNYQEGNEIFVSYGLISDISEKNIHHTCNTKMALLVHLFYY